jgi:arsenate reductase
MKRILIFCPENACRSQIMEAYLKFYAGNQVEVFSAGTQPGQLHPYAKAVMEEDGLDLKNHYPKELQSLPYHKFDHIIFACEQCQHLLPSKFKARKTFQFNIPLPVLQEGATHLQLLQSFRGMRNTIQKKLLIYIGKELSESPDTSPLQALYS